MNSAYSTHYDCANCGCSYAQHTKGTQNWNKYCRHCPCNEYVEGKALVEKPIENIEPDTEADGYGPQD